MPLAVARAGDAIAFLRKRTEYWKGGACVSTTPSGDVSPDSVIAWAAACADVASNVTPDTILSWHREFVARKWTFGGVRGGLEAYCPKTAPTSIRIDSDACSHFLLMVLFGWVEREQRSVIDFLREENRVLKAQLRGRRIRLTDDQRRRLAVFTTEVWTVRGPVTYLHPVCNRA